MDHADANGPTESEWFYELDGRTHGPLSRAALDDLLERCGETAVEVRVRKGPEGPWLPYRGHAAVPTQESGAAPCDPSASDPAAFRGTIPAKRNPGHSPPSRRWPGIRGRKGIRVWKPKHPEIVAAIALWSLTNLVLLFFWPQPHGPERRAMLALQEIQTKINELVTKPGSDSEWNEFTEHSKGTLAPIVRDLQQAKTSEPVQLLLLSCRDIVPKLGGRAGQGRQRSQWRLQRCLERANMILAGLDTN
jgi:hypothetical protein